MERKLIGDYERLHSTTEDYGSTGYKCLPYILPHVLALRPRSLIDYGCGRSDLARQVARKTGIPRFSGYDPAIPGLSVRSEEMFDVLINVDVLEHVPHDEIDDVLAEMASMASHALIIIDTAPARTILEDGRNAHVSLNGQTEWLRLLRPHFPTIRPVRIRRRARVAFKTWDEDLPGLSWAAIELRERLHVLWTKAQRARPRGLGVRTR